MRLIVLASILLAAPLAPGAAAQDNAEDAAERIEYAVDRALEWLARHQGKDGGWDGDGFVESCTDANRCEGKGYPTYDVGLTGLAVLAFLGSGHTHTKGPYRAKIGEAIKFLRRKQGPDGCFGIQRGHFMYAHAAATLAMAESYRLTQSPLLRRPVQKALEFLYLAQNRNPSDADGKLGWRYSIQPGDNDSSVTGWCVLALISAHRAGIEVSETALAGAREWYSRMTADNGRVGYVQVGVSPVRGAGREEKWPRRKSEAITALGIVGRDAITTVLGVPDGHRDELAKSAALCLERLPKWDASSGTIDHYYFLWGTLAMHRLGGDSWVTWRKAVLDAIGRNQRLDGCARGSWDPLGAWGEDGGRIYATAMSALAMELAHRYALVFGTR